MKLNPTGFAVALALFAMHSQSALANTPLPAGDPLANQQWFLKNTGQNAFSARGGVAGIDLNLAASHTRNILGSGVAISVIDDGLEIAHPDLAANVVAGSWNFTTNTNDPTPSSATAAHGTSVGGIAAAVAYNNIGGRGVAPRASLKGYNYLDSQTNESFLHAHGRKSGDPLPNGATASRVFNQSYGSSPTVSRSGNTATDLSLNLRETLYEEVTLNSHGGRGGLYVKSAGNGYNRIRVGESRLSGVADNNGLPFQNANLDSANSNYWNVVVSALNANGVRSSYSSVGSNVLLTAPGGEYGTDSPAMVTTDLRGCARGYNVNTAASANTLHGGGALDPSCDFNGVMNGTSSAAPSTSGAVALVMSANPQLSSRDVRNILIRTARRVDAAQPGVTLNFASRTGAQQAYQAIAPWQNNAANLPFHQFYGFGLVDVDRAVTMAQSNPARMPAQVKTAWVQTNVNKAIPDANNTGLSSTYMYNDALTVEAVQVMVDATHRRVNDLAVELISPSGTRSVLMTPRNHLVGETRGFNQHRMLSNQFYGEPARGVWTLRVIDTNGGTYQYTTQQGTAAAQTVTLNNASGTLVNWSIRFIGHRSAQ